MSQYDTPKLAESLVSERIINPVQYVCTGLWIINLGAESEIVGNDELLFAKKPRFARRATTSPKKKPHPKAGKRESAANWLCSRVLMYLLSLETSNTLRGNDFSTPIPMPCISNWRSMEVMEALAWKLATGVKLKL